MKRRQILWSTREAIQAAVSLHSLRAPTVVFADRRAYAELRGSDRKWDVSTIPLIIPHAQKGLGWTGIVKRMNYILGTSVQTRRLTFLSNIPRTGAPPLADPLVAVETFATPLEPPRFGYTFLEAGYGPVPLGLRYLFELRHASGELAMRRYRAVQRMRSKTGRDGFRAWFWDGKGRDALEPWRWMRSLHLQPDFWIRRRPCRNSTMLSLSIFGVHEVDRRLEIVDLTAAVATYATDPWNLAEAGEEWRRAIFLVDRGDGVEWIVDRPSCSPPVEGISREDAARLGDAPRPAYPGSAAIQIPRVLSEVLHIGSPRLHWVREDAPLPATDAPIK